MGCFFPHNNIFHTSQGLFYLIFTRYKGHHVPQDHLSESGMVSFGFWVLEVPGEKSPPKIVHLFPQAFLHVLACFSVFFRSQRPARARGPV